MARSTVVVGSNTLAANNAKLVGVGVDLSWNCNPKPIRTKLVTSPSNEISKPSSTKSPMIGFTGIGRVGEIEGGGGSFPGVVEGRAGDKRLGQGREFTQVDTECRKA
jgi:hypothetical protein